MFSAFRFGLTVCALVMCGACRTVLSEQQLAVRQAPQHFSIPKKSFEATDLGTASAVDSDADGFPDAAELTSFDDRRNFRLWFTRIAVAQYEHLSREWQAQQQDCAGLVRFAWREALRPHTRAWHARVPSVGEVADDVAAYTLARHPLHDTIFRTASGAHQPTDFETNAFASFADARSLKNYNSRFVSRDVREAMTGDLIFFHQPSAARYPYHVMIFVGKLPDHAGDDWIVYHTGISPDTAGEVRLLRLATLARHPQRRWRAVISNPNFLGFYRLKILD